MASTALRPKPTARTCTPIVSTQQGSARHQQDRRDLTADRKDRNQDQRDIKKDKRDLRRTAKPAPRPQRQISGVAKSNPFARELAASRSSGQPLPRFH